MSDRWFSGFRRSWPAASTMLGVPLVLALAACGEASSDGSSPVSAARCAENWKRVMQEADACSNDSARIAVLERNRDLFATPDARACERERLIELANVLQRQGQTDRLISVYDALLGDTTRLSPMEAAGVKLKLAKALLSIGHARAFDLAKEVFLFYRDHQVRSESMVESTALLVSTYEITGEAEECVAMLNGALDVAEKEQDIRWTCDLLDRLGGIATAQGRGAEAIAYHERSLRASEQFFRGGAVRDTLVSRRWDQGPKEDDDTTTAKGEFLTQGHYLAMRHRALSMRGDAHASLGDGSAAIADYEQAIALADSAFIEALFPPWTELGHLRLAQGNTTEAIRLGEKARDMATRKKDGPRLRDAAQLLHLAYKHQHDPVRALEMLELATAHGDGLSDDDFRMGLFKKQMSYSVQAHEDSMRVALAVSDRERQLNDYRARTARNWTFVIGAASLLLIVAGIFWYRADRRRRLERFEKDAAVLETQALRSQMNPHFIFNALNSINAFVQGNDPDMASSYLSKFARVMRLVLENSRHAEVPLESDLEALRGYLDLERKRMREKFDYTIDIDPELDPREVMVPPLVVQPFVENAIWHGMAGKDGQGHIRLRIQQNGEQLLWIIEDDGIGRQAHQAIKDVAEANASQFKEAAVPMKKTSLGTAITRARLDLVQKQYGGRAGWNYVDTPTGTRVEVDMPMRVGG